MYNIYMYIYIYYIYISHIYIILYMCIYLYDTSHSVGYLSHFPNVSQYTRKLATIVKVLVWYFSLYIHCLGGLCQDYVSLFPELLTRTSCSGADKARANHGISDYGPACPVCVNYPSRKAS